MLESQNERKQIYGVQQTNVNKDIISVQRHVTTYIVQEVCRLVFVWKFVFKKYIGLMEEDFLNTFTGDGNVTTKDSWFRTSSTEDLG